MNLRSLRLRAVGPPLAVAAICAVSLFWFDRIWIPAQQQYLNERNLRALRTISAQIKAKVDNFDQAIDHAIDSFPTHGGNASFQQDLQRYVKLFSSELEIVTFDTASPAAKVTPGDPPNVTIQRDEGRNYLYLGYRHEKAHRTGQNTPIELIARGDIDQATAPLLARSDFDALLLVDAKGATIAQQSSSGLELTSMTKVRDRGQSSAPNEQSVFERMRGTTGVAVVTIGAADYMLYTQPVQLSLFHESKKAGSESESKKAPTASESKKAASASEDKSAASASEDKNAAPAQEEWTLTGLVRLDRFRAASSTIPTTYWLWFGAVLALVCFAIPLLKPRVLSPRERLTRVDSVYIGAAIFMTMALATFTALDLRIFGWLVPAAVDQQLQSVATSMAAHVGQETEAVGKQMEALAGDRLWPKSLGYEHEPDAHSLDEIRRHLSREQGAEINLDAGAHSGSQAGRSQCKPSWSCRSGVLMHLPDLEYPFFKIMVWSDDAGWQRIKWSTSAVVTPFVNVGDSKLSYFESLKLARRLTSTRSDVPKNGVSVTTSPNTGEKITVFWQALPLLDPAKNTANDPVKNPAEPDMTGVTLVTAPVSLTEPLLPKNVQFAVVDRQGRVLFHTDASRSLAENMFQESEDSPTLKSLVTSRETGAFTARYLGRAHRFFVRPLDLTPFDTRWSLLVFQASAVTETANLGTLNLAVSLFVVYVLAIAAIWTVLGLFWPDAVKSLLWPLPIKGPQYRRAAMVGTVVGLICIGVIASGMPTNLLLASTALTAGALVAMFVLVRAGADSAHVSPTWSSDFVWARASMLLLLTAAPAALCFHLSYTFHSELVAKRAESQLTSDLNTRARRISQQTQRVAICTESDPGLQACPGIGDLVNKRTRETFWDVDVPLVSKAEAESAGQGGSLPGPLQSFLSLSYRPYNDVAADLLMTAPPRPNQGLESWPPTVGEDRKDGDRIERFAAKDSATEWRFAPAITPTLPVNAVAWLLAAALMGVACLLVRYLLLPIFAREFAPATTLLEASGASEDTSLLVLGPAGSRRTARLLRHPRVRIFDVRSLSFAEDPAKRTAADEPISSAADCGHGDHSSSWGDEIHEATSHPFTIIALDYLEYRLDDPAFRATMLECLESAVYRDGGTIWCSSVRDPIELLDELDPPAPDRRQWARVFEKFRREHLGLEVDPQRSIALAKELDRCATGLAPDVRRRILTECGIAPELLTIAENLVHRLPPDTALSAEEVLEEIGSGARYFYEGLWNGCSTSEKVVLRQLAEEGLVNPNNQSAVSRMLNAGLVRHGQTFEIMNETFRRFVLSAATHDVVSSWEREGVSVPWGTIATTGVTVAFGLAGLLLLTQEQLVDAWISYVPALAPAIPTVWKVLAGVQKGKIEIPV
jgi:hypothetical protein